MTDFQELSAFRLKFGGHNSAEEGLCAMEAVAWLEGLEHTDAPECTCPIIAIYVRRLNDSLPDDERQKLVTYLPKLVGTVSPDDEQARAEYLAWQAIRVFAPFALDSMGLTEQATELRHFDGSLSDIDITADVHWIVDFAYAAAYYAAASDAFPAATSAVASYAYAAGYIIACCKADRQYIIKAGFQCLDGLLAIGKQAEPFSRDVHASVKAYRELVAT